MRDLYVWTVEYQVSGTFVSRREVKVVTESDSYGEAERLALKYINESLEESKFKFDFIFNIKPSEKAWGE